MLATTDPMDLGVGKEGMIKFATMAKQWVDDGIPCLENLDNTTAKSMFLNAASQNTAQTIDVPPPQTSHQGR